MRIAILGTRGIPANYGGFETFAEELATRLVERGHDVTVYARSNNVRRPSGIYRGVRLVVLPTIPTKHLDTVAHTFLSALHSFGRGYEVVLMCNAVNAVFCGLLRLSGVPVALNVDGIERMRRKWGPAGRLAYRVSEYLATAIPSVVITDANVIRDYFLNRHRVDSVMIAYGTDCRVTDETACLDRLGLAPRGYFLYVSRLEPENNAHMVIEAFGSVKTEMPLLIVGDAPYARAYIRRLKSTADARVLFPGAIYGNEYVELRSHAFAYVQATEVGGTHPALLEAMGSGNCVLAKDTPEHREVLDGAGLYFEDSGDLSTRMVQILADTSLVERLRCESRVRAETCYSWGRVTDQYESLFRTLCQ